MVLLFAGPTLTTGCSTALVLRDGTESLIFGTPQGWLMAAAAGMVPGTVWSLIDAARIELQGR